MTPRIAHATVEAGGPTVTDRTIGVMATTTRTARRSLPNGVKPSLDERRRVTSSSVPPRAYRCLPMLDRNRRRRDRIAASVTDRSLAASPTGASPVRSKGQNLLQRWIGVCDVDLLPARTRSANRCGFMPEALREQVSFS
jgi:hypothetical protein